nr:MAG TPA: hypothetical protein [Caudoviricetes sp.]
MTNPAHQSHKVSGVCHYTTVSVLQDLHPLIATMQTGIPPQGGMGAIVASVRRAFTDGFPAVQNGCMKSREVLPHFRKFTCVSVLMIRLFIARDKQTGALSWRVLSHPKAPYRLCNFVPVVLLSAL